MPTPIFDVSRVEWEAVPALHTWSDFRGHARTLDAIQWWAWELENEAWEASWENEELNDRAEAARHFYESKRREAWLAVFRCKQVEAEERLHEQPR